jgi:Skp family chaperone for outer membrane proteins
VTSQRLRAELAESRSHLEAKKQDVEKLQRLTEDLQTKLSELTAGHSSREQQQAKEVDKLQAMLAHMEREIQTIRCVSVCYLVLSTPLCVITYTNSTNQTAVQHNCLLNKLYLWRQHVSTVISKPSSGIIQFPNQNLKMCYS